MISNFELVYCLYRSFGEQCNPCVLIVLMFPVWISFLVGLETPVSIGICKKLNMVTPQITYSLWLALDILLSKELMAIFSHSFS